MCSGFTQFAVAPAVLKRAIKSFARALTLDGSSTAMKVRIRGMESSPPLRGRTK
jgi:hypothetical protein